MFLKYKNQTGEISGRIIAGTLPRDVSGPVIEVPDDTPLENKKVDPETEELVWNCTLSEAKSDKIREIKDRAYEVLSETDWYITREQEIGKAIPQDILDHRSQVRSDSDTFEQEVNNLTAVEEVLNYEYSFPEPPKP